MDERAPADPAPADDPRRDRGAGPAYREYALALALIAVVAVLALAALGGETSRVLSAVSGSI